MIPDNLTSYLALIARWMMSDAEVRRAYEKETAADSKKFQDEVEAEHLEPTIAAHAASAKRSQWVTEMQRRSSPVGLLAATILKPTTPPPEYFLNKYARLQFNKDYENLDKFQAKAVSLMPNFLKKKLSATAPLLYRHPPLIPHTTSPNQFQ
jgi:hypothetical protein